MKSILITLILMTGSFAFAGGSTSGTGLGSSSSQNSDSQIIQDQTADDSSTIGAPPAIENLIKGDSQVYYMGENEREVQFATNIKGTPKVNVRRLNPKVDFDKELFEGLKQSQETGEWVDLKKIKLPETNSLMKQGGLRNRIKGGSLNGFGGGMGRGGF